MKKTLLAAALAAAFAAPSLVYAQAKSPHTFTGNVTVANDYRFRGISQTFEQPTIQGGFDYSHANGFYAGMWASNVYGNQVAAALGSAPVYAGGSIEMDFYGGYKFSVGDFGFDVGFLQYYYPNAKYVVPTTEKYNNQELYGAASWKWFTLKYSHGLSNFFGYNQNTNGATFCGISKDTPGVFYTPANAPDGCMNANGGSKGSGYLDLTGTVEIGAGFNLTGHIGHQTVKNYGKLSYTDWKVGVTKEWVGLTFGLAVIGTNAKESFYRVVEPDGAGNFKQKDTGDTTAVVSISKTF